MQYEKYAKVRDERGLTDYAVAKATGVAAASLSAWKRGVYVPKLDKIRKIADYFGVPVTVFLE